MTHETQPLDLSALAKDRSLEIVYPFDEIDEYEPTINLIPLAAAVDLGLGKVVRTEDKSGEYLYVVVPAVINTKQESEAHVTVVRADWSECLNEKEVTTYTFTKCIACGGPLVDESTEEITQEKIPCGYCGTPNQSISPQTKKVEIRKIEVENIDEEGGWVGTVEELTKEIELYQAKGRFKRLFTSEPAPRAAIQAGRDLVRPDQKIVIAGSFSDSDQKDLFVQIGELRAITKKREERELTHEVVSRGERFPRTPGAYLLEEIKYITDRNDYLVIIEADSGEKLPLVVMNDKEGNPNRFVVPVGELLEEGWRVMLGGSGSTLNEIIKRNDLQKESGPNSVGAEDYGTVKVFNWNTDSDRHEAITDELSYNDLDYDCLYVSADIPHGDVSAIHIENTG